MTSPWWTVPHHAVGHRRKRWCDLLCRDRDGSSGQSPGIQQAPRKWHVCWCSHRSIDMYMYICIVYRYIYIYISTTYIYICNICLNDTFTGKPGLLIYWTWRQLGDGFGSDLEIPPTWDMATLWLWLTVCHGKIHPFLRTVSPGKPSISIRAIYTMAMLNNKRVSQNICRIMPVSVVTTRKNCSPFTSWDEPLGGLAKQGD